MFFIYILNRYGILYFYMSYYRATDITENGVGDHTDHSISVLFGVCVSSRPLLYRKNTGASAEPPECFHSIFCECMYNIPVSLSVCLYVRVHVLLYCTVRSRV